MLIWKVFYIVFFLTLLRERTGEYFSNILRCDLFVFRFSELISNPQISKKKLCVIWCLFPLIVLLIWSFFHQIVKQMSSILRSLFFFFVCFTACIIMHIRCFFNIHESTYVPDHLSFSIFILKNYLFFLYQYVCMVWANKLNLHSIKHDW